MIGTVMHNINYWFLLKPREISTIIKLDTLTQLILSELETKNNLFNTAAKNVF